MLLDLLKDRTSVRSFTQEPISHANIQTILEAGRLSPSGGNEQSWVFGVIDDRETIEFVSRIAYNQNWITSARFLIVLCTRMVEKSRGGRDIQKSRFPSLSETIENMDDRLYASLNMEEHQTKIPGTHMVLAAQELGIASTWISYFQVEALNQRLNLPSSLMASEIIAFGYPVKHKQPTPKKPLEAITFYNIVDDGRFE